jgi:hypothetical protein
MITKTKRLHNGEELSLYMAAFARLAREHKVEDWYSTLCKYVAEERERREKIKAANEAFTAEA